jgi:hypothetical protein
MISTVPGKEDCDDADIGRDLCNNNRDGWVIVEIKVPEVDIVGKLDSVVAG